MTFSLVSLPCCVILNWCLCLGALAGGMRGGGWQQVWVCVSGGGMEVGLLWARCLAGRLRCGAAWSSGSQCGGFRCLGLSWAGVALVLLAGLLAVRLLSSLSAAWFLFQCSRILTILLSLGKMEADSRIKGAQFKSWQGIARWPSLGALRPQQSNKAMEFCLGQVILCKGVSLPGAPESTC
ncbi:Hypothetical_protein [Hexamita inflata]|uniref:Hypothetical_protein n=1 Tax=Hexamita inflata TaxID=28002 RepID=A0ABP1HDK4_9EUKA